MFWGPPLCVVPLCPSPVLLWQCGHRGKSHPLVPWAGRVISLSSQPCVYEPAQNIHLTAGLLRAVVKTHLSSALFSANSALIQFLTSPLSLGQVFPLASQTSLWTFELNLKLLAQSPVKGFDFE